MKKRIFISLLTILLFTCYVNADSGPDSKNSVDPTFEDWGDKCRVRGLSVSSTSMTPVVISTYPQNSDFGIKRWRYREIVNTSTASAIRLIFNEDRFTVFSTSVGVVLSSDTTGLGNGQKHTDRSNCKISAIQSHNTGIGGNGVSVREYYKK